MLPNITATVLGGVSQLETRASVTLLSFGKHSGRYGVARLGAAEVTPYKFSKLSIICCRVGFP